MSKDKEEKELNPKEVQQKHLNEMPWPPILELEGQEIQLDEFDVNWTFCTVLNMRWADAKQVTDEGERRFLWSKAQIMAAAMQQQADEIDAKKRETEQVLRAKMEDLKQQSFQEATHQAATDLTNSVNL